MASIKRIDKDFLPQSRTGFKSRRTMGLVEHEIIKLYNFSYYNFETCFYWWCFNELKILHLFKQIILNHLNMAVINWHIISNLECFPVPLNFKVWNENLNLGWDHNSGLILKKLPLNEGPQEVIKKALCYDCKWAPQELSYKFG